MSHKFKRISVIINPVSGRAQPVLSVVNRVFADHRVQWKAFVTYADVDISQTVEEALAFSPDLIAVYGGDGTISSVASILVDHSIPIAVLPGGTANVLAVEFGIPFNLEQALQAIFSQGYALKAVDAGKMNDRYFFLRVSFGLEADIMKGAERDAKSYLGSLAYVLSGLKALLQSQPRHYDLIIDGKKIKAEGLSLIVANSGNIGVPGMRFSDNIFLNDGKLDVIIIRHADIFNLFEMNEHAHKPLDSNLLFQCWQAEQSIQIHSSDAQTLQWDGEVLEVDQLDISVVSNASTFLINKQHRIFKKL